MPSINELENGLTVVVDEAEFDARVKLIRMELRAR